MPGRGWSAGAFAALVVMLGAVAPARAAEPISKTESRALPARVVTPWVLDQLGLVEEAGARDAATPPLVRRVFWTRPRASDAAGTCESDRTTVTWAPTGVIGVAADVRLATLPGTRRDDGSSALEGRAQARADAACARLNPASGDRFRLADAVALAPAAPAAAHPAAVRRIDPRARRELAAALQPWTIEGTRSRHPRNTLRELDFRLSPHATWTAGLCASDDVVLMFRPADPTTHGPDAPAVAERLIAYDRFRFLSAPSPRAAPLTWQDRVRADATCATLDKDSVSFFDAADEETAVAGAQALMAANAALARGALAAPPGCAPHDDLGGCLALAAPVPVEHIYSVEACDAAPETGCWTIGTRAGTLHLITVARNGALEVTLASVTHDIVIADMMAD